jgi:hypothetical protein
MDEECFGMVLKRYDSLASGPAIAGTRHRQEFASRVTYQYGTERPVVF